MRVGDKLKVDSEKRRYTVQAADDRFVIATKPFAARKTYLYIIVDRERGVRGACNMIFGLPCDVDNPETAAEALAMLQSGHLAVSRRNVDSLTAAEIEQLEERTSSD